MKAAIAKVDESSTVDGKRVPKRDVRRTRLMSSGGDRVWKDEDVKLRGQTGVVKWFSVRDGYGFIARDGASEDESELFVHRSCIKTPNTAHLIESLNDGEKVTFDTVHDSKGDEAVNVTGINGAVVVGSEHAPRKADTDLPSWAAKLPDLGALLTTPAEKQPSRHYGKRVSTHTDDNKTDDVADNRRVAREFVNKWTDDQITERGVLGKVKWFSLRRGFGFGVRDDAKDENDEFFVHRTSVLKPNPDHVIESLGIDERIKFDLVDTGKGFEAVNITSDTGSSVKGHVHAPHVGVVFVPYWVYALLIDIPLPSVRSSDKGSRKYERRGRTLANKERRGSVTDARRTRRRRGTRVPVYGENGDAVKSGNEEKPVRRRGRRNYGRGGGKAKATNTSVNGDEKEQGTDAEGAAGRDERPHRRRRNRRNGKSGDELDINGLKLVDKVVEVSKAKQAGEHVASQRHDSESKLEKAIDHSVRSHIGHDRVEKETR